MSNTVCLSQSEGKTLTAEKSFHLFFFVIVLAVVGLCLALRIPFSRPPKSLWRDAHVLDAFEVVLGLWACIAALKGLPVLLCRLPLVVEVVWDAYEVMS